MARYRSRRLALSLPLPDGAAWRIDDHTHPELMATHAPTRSRIVVAVFWADSLVGRRECEAIARERNIIPVGVLQVLEDEATLTQGTFDTRIEVGLVSGETPDRPIVGHVMAFGGFLRKCYAFDFSTEVASAREEDGLSSRLAFARTRILGGLVLGSIDALARDPGPSGRAPERSPSSPAR